MLPATSSLSRPGVNKLTICIIKKEKTIGGSIQACVALNEKVSCIIYPVNPSSNMGSA
jgi:hypothetical protein